MKNQKKISVLEKAIQMLVNGFEYDWLKTESCNCGVVASAALGKVITHQDATKCGDGAWVTKTKSGYCSITGLQLCEIQFALSSAGFAAVDLEQLELLNNRDIRHRAFGLKSYVDQKEKGNLIAYLRAWVEILKEQDEEKPEPKKYHIIHVASAISEQARQTLLTQETIAL